MGQKDFVIYTDIVSSSRYEANQIKELNDTLYGINKRTFCPPPIVFPSYFTNNTAMRFLVPETPENSILGACSNFVSLSRCLIVNP